MYVRALSGVNSLDEIQITGGRALEGSVIVQGSKNAALPMMAASLLHRGVSVLRGCPRITDVYCMEEILKKLGAVSRWEGKDLYLDCTRADGTEICGDSTGRMRSSVILLGAMLGRSGRGTVGYPGGCVIGKRPVDIHVFALRCLGVSVQEKENGITARRLRSTGGTVVFPKKSVGATEQAVLSSVLSDGETVLKNCAREPEIVWLCRYLRGMGACITGEGSSCIRIQGVSTLNGGDLRVPADRIVAGTYLCAAAATRGRIIIENPPEGELDAFLDLYRKIGGQYEGKSGKLIADGRNVRFPVTFLETEAYPGFPTDLQSPVMAVLATIPGESHIRENIFEDRFRLAGELNKMGAAVRVSGKDAWIRGTETLQGCPVTACELRGGAALVLAALAARGDTVIRGYSYIRRGYEHICSDLAGLGAVIREINRNSFI